MHSEQAHRLKSKQDELNTNPLLNSVELLVTTEDGLFFVSKIEIILSGIETLTVHFQNADRRAIWENTFNDAKNAFSMCIVGVHGG